MLREHAAGSGMVAEESCPGDPDELVEVVHDDLGCLFNKEDDNGRQEQEHSDRDRYHQDTQIFRSNRHVQSSNLPLDWMHLPPWLVTYPVERKQLCVSY